MMSYCTSGLRMEKDILVDVTYKQIFLNWIQIVGRSNFHLKWFGNCIIYYLHSTSQFIPLPRYGVAFMPSSWASLLLFNSLPHQNVFGTMLQGCIILTRQSIPTSLVMQSSVDINMALLPTIIIWFKALQTQLPYSYNVKFWGMWYWRMDHCKICVSNLPACHISCEHSKF